VSDAETPPPIEFLDVYRQALVHQMQHRPEPLRLLAWWMVPKPSRICTTCMIEQKAGDDAFFDLPRKYSWAVPTEEALTTIAGHSPRGVVEIGAGGGYWAMLLRERGVDVVAYDPDPSGLQCYSRYYRDGTVWSSVEVGDHAAAANHPDRTLMLCWPESGEDWPAAAVRAHGGSTVVYIGQPGVTGNDDLHRLLNAEFVVTGLVGLPQWMGLEDDLSVYTRVHYGNRTRTLDPVPTQSVVTEPQPEIAGEAGRGRPTTWGTSGSVALTDAVIEHLVGEAERGYEPHQVRKRDEANPR
jgi:hypothetical protein